MALSYRAGVLTGVAFSAVAALLLPRWGRPAAKVTIKGGMAAYESASETLARLRETLEDIAAEAAFERAADYAAGAEAARPAAVPRPERQEPETTQPVVAE